MAWIWALCVLVALFVLTSVLFYRKYPLHLIYKSKVGLQDMIDGISDPLAVISSDYVLKRVNKSYTKLVSSDFADIIGCKCFTILRHRTTPCQDCLLKETIISRKQSTVERAVHPSEKGAVSINFSPFTITESDEPGIVEHLRDITLLEKLKLDLQKKNRSLARTMKTLKVAQENIKDELRLARMIQQGILPKSAPVIDGLKISVSYHPVADVGGDIYDFIQFSPRRIGIFIGDASGHGLAAAFIGTISKMSLYNHSKFEMPVDQLLSNLNQDLIDNVHTGHYLTCFWGIIDLDALTLTFCRAGHPVPVLIKNDGTTIPLKTSGTFIGLIPESTYEQQTVTFDKGDRIYLFTDGIYEVFDTSDSKNEMLGYDRFVTMLSEYHGQKFSKSISMINQHLSKLTYDDDYTFIAIETT